MWFQFYFYLILQDFSNEGSVRQSGTNFEIFEQELATCYCWQAPSNEKLCSHNRPYNMQAGHRQSFGR